MSAAAADGRNEGIRHRGNADPGGNDQEELSEFVNRPRGVILHCY